MKKFSKLLEKPWFAYTFALCVAVMFYMVITHISPLLNILNRLFTIVKPLFIGFIIAYLLNPIVNFFDRLLKKVIDKEEVYHVFSVVITIVCIGVLLAVLGWLIVPSIVDSISSIIRNIPRYQKNVDWAIEQLKAIAVNVDFSAIEKVLGNLTNTIVGVLPRNINAIVSTSISIGAFLYNAVLGVILAIYFLIGKSQLFATVRKLRKSMVNDEVYKRQTDFVYRCHNIIIKYLGCDLLDSVIVAIINAIIMTIFKMPLVPLVSLIVGVTNLAPTFGPMAGGAMGALILLFNYPKDALVFIIITLVIQTLDGYVIKPKLFGGSLGVPAVWILVAIIVGGNMFGVAGILLAIPFAAIFTFVYDEALIPYLIANKERREAEKKKTN